MDSMDLSDDNVSEIIYLEVRDMGVIITSAIAICSIVAIFCFFIAYRRHKEKGFIFNNVWLYASQKEGENMDVRLKKRA